MVSNDDIIISSLKLKFRKGMEMIKIIDTCDLEDALYLVNKVFDEFVAADYSEEGKNTFTAYLNDKYEEVLSDLESGQKKLWGYYIDDKIVGVIGTRDTTHISLMFVDKEYHKRGIAKELFNIVLDEINNDSINRFITVNSSPYAVEVYEHLGFVKTDEQQENDGILYVPMKHKL